MKNRFKVSAKEGRVLLLRKRWLAIPGAVLCVRPVPAHQSACLRLCLVHPAAAAHLLRAAGL